MDPWREIAQDGMDSRKKMCKNEKRKMRELFFWIMSEAEVSLGF